MGGGMDMMAEMARKLAARSVPRFDFYLVLTADVIQGTRGRNPLETSSDYNPY